MGSAGSTQEGKERKPWTVRGSVKEEGKYEADVEKNVA